jgi:predicted  nucleic acid-binding Zn-ribbon protein
MELFSKDINKYVWPERFQNCCKKSWATYQLINKKTGKTVPIVNYYCTTCGTQIRPMERCCNDYLNVNEFKRCGKCGAFLDIYRVKPRNAK